MISTGIRLFALPTMAGFLAACGGTGITKIKYTYDGAAQSVRLLDNSVVTAPANSHFGIFNINCIDNSGVDSGLFYARNKLRLAGDATSEVPNVVPPKFQLVGAGAIEEGLGPVVFLINAPAGETYTIGESNPVTLPLHYELNYTSSAGESVLMVLQNHAKHAPAISSAGDPYPANSADLQPANKLYGQSNYLGNINLCANQSTSPH